MNYDGMMRCDSLREKSLRGMNFTIGRLSKGTARAGGNAHQSCGFSKPARVPT
jgi:hypothetical protein